MSPDGLTGLPAPQAAYARWLDALSLAGWAAGRDTPDDSTDSAGPRDDGGEDVAVGVALGRVTAGPVIARLAAPQAACAAMDGIAVSWADLSTAPVSQPDVSETVRLAAGAFQWIDTGDPMPDGTDTVVIRERLLPQADGSVLVAPRGGGGRNVRTVGEDFAAGAVLVQAGRRLRPGDLAAAAAGGHATVRVSRRPAVAVIPTGDEVRPVGSALRRGDIIDTNSLMLAARCSQLGAAPWVSAVVPDAPDALAAGIRRAAGHADLVLVIAGSSLGRDDHTSAVISQVGGLAVAGVAVRPGHPAILGHVKRGQFHGATSPSQGLSQYLGQYQGQYRDSGVAPVIGLPGYPLAAAVIFELFAVPLLAAALGYEPLQARAPARLDREWRSPAGVEEWVPVTLSRGAGGVLPLASPARRGAGSVSQFAQADAWWPIPAGLTDIAEGNVIEILPLEPARLSGAERVIGCRTRHRGSHRSLVLAS
jgi:putative molybdopterin biosynthesis protein